MATLNKTKNKHYTLTGVGEEIELGRDGLKISNESQADISFKKNHNNKLINIQIADGVQENHAITKKQYDYLEELIQKNIPQGPFFPVDEPLIVDVADGNVFIIDLENATSNIDLTLENAKSGNTYLIVIIQGPVSYDINWLNNPKWQQAGDYHVSSQNDSIDIVQFLYLGDMWFGNSGLDYAN